MLCKAALWHFAAGCRALLRRISGQGVANAIISGFGFALAVADRLLHRCRSRFGRCDDARSCVPRPLYPFAPEMTAPSSDTASTDLARQKAPPLRRRLASFLYEGVLLFGVSFTAAFIYSTATRQQHALQGRTGLGLVLLVVVGLYFVWLWTRSGQTLAMQTWHVRLLTVDGQPVGVGRAIARYLCSWVWFAPPLLALWWLGLTVSGWAVFGIILAWVLCYAALSFLHPRRQFWHDALCGTQLVPWVPPAAQGKR